MRITGAPALERFLVQRPKRVLDIGAGEGHHAQIMRDSGVEVTTLNRTPPADIVGDYLTCDVLPRDLWVSHVLEHQPDPGRFLRKLLADCSGLLAITVPYDRRDIVGGHVTAWTEGLLIYNLVVAGFDCRKAAVGICGRQLSVVMHAVRRPSVDLGMCRGDIELLQEFFPWPVQHGSTALLGPVNWT